MKALSMKKQGLYDPAFEHDACGVAFVARLDAQPTHEAVARALTALENLEHRGAAGADADTGDGAGILVQTPDAFLRAVAGLHLPPRGAYGVGVCFLPQRASRRLELEQLLEETVEAEGQTLLGWRDVPVDGQARRLACASLRAGRAPALRRRVGRARGRSRRVRAQAVRDPARRRARRRPRPRRAEPLRAHARLQGDADRAAARALLPGPRRRRASRARWRSCTRASRRTRSRAGSSRTRTA